VASRLFGGCAFDQKEEKKKKKKGKKKKESESRDLVLE
jgi:hypothetical protein